MIILGILKQEPCGAYDIQKAVEYRNISKWVKVSTPSVYKKVLLLEERGLIIGRTEKNGKMPEKVVYSLTKLGEEYFTKLMLSLSDTTIALLFDFNAVIVNLDKVPLEIQEQCLNAICKNVTELRTGISNMIEERKHIPQNGRSIMLQQLRLAEVLENWVNEIKIENQF